MEQGAEPLASDASAARVTLPAAQPSAGHPSLAGCVLRGHAPVLDGVRGIAIVMVLIFHLRTIFGLDRSTHWLDRAVFSVINHGHIGVDLFFVLSGFLITGLLCDAAERPGGLKRFWIRRALRIFPLYYFYVLLIWYILPHIGMDFRGKPRVPAWPYFLYINNMYTPMVHGFLGNTPIAHLWTLAIEEQFYLVWPLVVVFGRNRLSWNSALAVGAAFVATRMAIVQFGLYDACSKWIDYQFPTRADGLLWGALLALSARRSDGFLSRRWHWLALGAVGLLICIYRNSFNSGVMNTLMYGMHSLGLAWLFAAIIVLGLTVGQVGKLLARPYMIEMGRISYSLYVWHLFLIGLMLWVFPASSEMSHLIRGSAIIPWIVFTFLACVGSVAMAELSMKYIEMPFLKMKDKWGGRPAPAAEKVS